MNIFDLLRARHPAPEWAFFAELRNSVGFTRVTRTADAMAFNTFMGRGLEVHGFEIKTDRRDWLREKRNPEKAEEMFAVCDRWWLVVSDRDIVTDEELPVNWGLLTVGGKTRNELVVSKKAPKLKPRPMKPGLLAMLLRRAVEERVDQRLVAQEVEKRIASEREDWREERKKFLELTQKLHGADALRQAVDDFERTSGVKIDKWHGGNIGRVFKIAMEMSPERAIIQLDAIRAQVRGLSATLDAVIEPHVAGKTG